MYAVYVYDELKIIYFRRRQDIWRRPSFTAF